MITAIVMIDAATDSIPEVASSIADLDGVSEVYSTAGEVDLIAIVRVREYARKAMWVSVSSTPGTLLIRPAMTSATWSNSRTRTTAIRSTLPAVE